MEVPSQKAPAPADEPSVPSHTDAQSSLRRVGLRATGPRVAVYLRLAASDRPLSHADLTEGLVPAGFDRATVYRNLVDLVEAGLAVRHDLGDHVWRFELRRPVSGTDASDGPHPHFTCRDCGTVSCLPGVQVQVRSPGPSIGSAVFDEVHLKGRCGDCRGPGGATTVG